MILRSSAVVRWFFVKEKISGPLSIDRLCVAVVMRAHSGHESDIVLCAHGRIRSGSVLVSLR